MSKIKHRWLWIVVVLEVGLIGGLLIWGIGLQSAKHPAPVQPAPQATRSYKSPKVELALIAGGFAQPTAIVATGNTDDTRLFVLEQSGTARAITATGATLAGPLLDISSKVQNSGEMGLLGLAFHPKVGKAHPYLYLNYVDKTQTTIIARYTITFGSPIVWSVDPASEKVLLRIKQPYPNHNGGNMAFGPDGYLYIGMGDGGAGGDPENRAQNPNELLGKILRINVDAGEPFAIPADNPFAKNGGKPEIWDMGLRNPWRFSFDRQTGDLYIADVGQGNYEEIDYEKAGGKGGNNYGWRCYEGLNAYNAEHCQPADSYARPATIYDHTEGRCSVTGGFVYRGSRFPALSGRYFYGDYCGGQLYYGTWNSGVMESMLAAKTDLGITAFGEDNTGELYVADYKTGSIYRITDTANP